MVAGEAGDNRPTPPGSPITISHQPADGHTDTEAVAKAVGTLLNDGEVRENVQRLAKVYARQDPLDAIEQVLPAKCGADACGRGQVGR